MTLLGLNLAATIITMRAPGMTWTRLPIFCWAVLATSALMFLAAPMLIAALLMGAMDRTLQTAFYIPGAGGSAYLFQNLFWVFGHPEVYVVAIPGFGIVLELLPVFARKPLWGYRLAVAGMLGVWLLSFFVWQHHLFVSGINADLRPFYMLSTELISIPTGFTFLCFMGTLWRGRIRFTVPMLFCLAWAFNFLFGGISGVFNSDVPSDVTTHGSFFVMAHFHYTIMGGLVFTFFAAIYYWLPEDDRVQPERATGEDPLLDDVPGLQLDVRAAVRARVPGEPRRVVTYPQNFQALNIWVSVSAFVLGISMLVFLYNVVWSLLIKREPAPRRTRGNRSRRSGSCRRRCPCTTSSAPRISTRTRIPTASSRHRGPPVVAPAERGGIGHGSLSLDARAAHRARAPGVAAAGNLGLGPAVVRVDRLLLRVVRVRLFLPAGDQLQPRLEDRLGQSLARARRGDRGARGPQRDRLPARGDASPTGRARGGDRGDRDGGRRDRAPVHRVSRSSTSEPPAAATPACSSAGPRRTPIRDRLRLLDGDPDRQPLAGAARACSVRVAEGVPAEDVALMRAGVEACSFFWAFFAAIGVLAFIILYLV